MSGARRRACAASIEARNARRSGSQGDAGRAMPAHEVSSKAAARAMTAHEVCSEATMAAATARALLPRGLLLEADEVGVAAQRHDGDLAQAERGQHHPRRAVMLVE